MTADRRDEVSYRRPFRAIVDDAINRAFYRAIREDARQVEREIQRQVDEEGCGATIAALIYGPNGEREP